MKKMKEIILKLVDKTVGVEITVQEAIDIKHYLEELEDDRDFLYALQAAGVDNWYGYGEACKIYHEEEDY